MRKFCICLLVLSIFSSFTFAGDVAQYVDLGFSPNGKYYSFAQYGITDKDFLPYAEIFCIDVEKNEYIPGAVFRSNKQNSSKSQTGLELYENLYKKNKSVIDKYSGLPATLDNTIYLRGPESKQSSEEIIFKDFTYSTPENEIFYYVNLIKNVNTYGKKVKSSFFISVERKDAQEKVLTKQIIGTPDFERLDVQDYIINKITTDKTGKMLIFQVEKKVIDSKGISFRYMVETLVLK